MKKASKRFRRGKENLEKEFYTLEEAVQKIKEFPKTKFDESVELSFHLGVDTKKSDQAVRGSVSLPHGTGRKIKVLVFCKGEEAKEAEEAGADYVGAEAFIQKINEGWLDFDVVVSHPEMMKEITKLGRILGPRNLMPSPKMGTVTKDLGHAVKEIKKGKIEFKNDKNAGIHVAVGKVSFEASQITENVKTVVKKILESKPQSSKGIFLRTVSLSSTMGPGLQLDRNSF